MSSAYILGCEKYRQLGRSLIYNRKSKGPRIVPWGIPHLTNFGVDIEEFIRQVSVRLLKYDVNHL